jgi:hypothetical protein
MVDAIDPVSANSLVQDIPEPDLPQQVEPATDTALLSIPAQVQILEQQEFNFVQIASQLGLSTNLLARDIEEISPVQASPQVSNDVE